MTIIGQDGLTCDGLSTALFVKGLGDSIGYWKTHEGFDAIFITEDGNAYVTEGIENSFSLSSEYYDQKVTVLKR